MRLDDVFTDKVALQGLVFKIFMKISDICNMNLENNFFKKLCFILVLFASSLFMQSCNPFGKNSYINISPEFRLLNEPNHFGINNGGNLSVSTPDSGNVSDSYRIKYKLSAKLSQGSHITNGGYMVKLR
jgi:hypothetical protein